MNYRSWQAEILQEHAEGCDLRRNLSRHIFVVFKGWFLVDIFRTFHLVIVPNSADIGKFTEYCSQNAMMGQSP